MSNSNKKSKYKKTIPFGDLVVCQRRLAADLGGKYTPAIVAGILYQWQLHNERTKKNMINGEAWVFMSLEDIVKKELPELSLSQVRTALKTLAGDDIIKVYKEEKMLPGGKRPANNYRLTEKGLKYFPRFQNDTEENDAESLLSMFPDDAIRSIKDMIRKELYNEIKKKVLSELKVDNRKRSQEVQKVEVDKELHDFLEIFKKYWNKRLPKHRIKFMTDQRIYKIKSILNLEMRANKITIREAEKRLLMVISLVSKNPFLKNEIGGNGIDVDWLLKQEPISYEHENYIKIVEGKFRGCINLDEYIKRRTKSNKEDK